MNRNKIMWSLNKYNNSYINKKIRFNKKMNNKYKKLIIKKLMNQSNI